MPTYGTLEAKNRFSELIERAERGEEVVITRHGKPVIRFHLLNEVEERRSRANAALERIRARAKQTNAGITSTDILDFVREGRR